MVLFHMPQRARIPWSDDDSDEEEDVLGRALCGASGEFVRALAEFMRVNVADLLRGHDNGMRAEVPWCCGEDRLYGGNPLRLTEAVVRARDKAYEKLRYAGIRSAMARALCDAESRAIFVRLAATYYAYTAEITDLRKDLASLFRRRPALRHFG